MEHSLSEEVVDKLDKMLKSPHVCPDGNPIPAKQGNIVELRELPEKNNEVGFPTPLSLITYCLFITYQPKY